MTICGGCKQNQLLLAEVLCLPCVEDLKLWLKTIPVLFEELEHVRLPGSVRQSGPYAKTSSMGGAAPVRLEVVDLADRGEVRRRLVAAWPGLEFTTYDVAELCQWYSQHLLDLVMRDGAEDMYRKIRGLVRDLGRTVGEPQDLPVGKCPRPVGDELCRGQLLRAGDTAVVYCRRCGDRPEIVDQQVWVTAMEAHLIVGKPLKTVRNWFNRKQVGWGPPVAPGLGWLPIIVRRAALATISQSSDNVNPESGAEPSKDQRPTQVAGTSSGRGSDSDGDVLGSEAPARRSGPASGNVTLPSVRTVGTVVAPDSSSHGSGFGGEEPGPLPGPTA